jgi:hypothetical protein
VRGRQTLVLVVWAGLALVGGACTVGSGSGVANGALFVDGCYGSHAAGKIVTKPYELNPTFFAGEPIEDTCPPPGPCPGEHMNRLLIRIQRTGNRIEVNDTLYFDVENAFEVARCVRGRLDGGQPDWDTRVVSNADGTLTAVPWCDWGAGPATATGARINLSTENYVRASFSPLYTCTEARLVGVAIAPGSWVEFSDFGGAVQPGKAPAERAAVDSDFKVDFNQRLSGTFHLELEDQRVTSALKGRDPVPGERITGVLDGSFDFDLERGRAAQPFP